MKRYHFITVSSLAVVFSLASCVSDLDTTPINKRVYTSSSIYDDPASFKLVLAKLYGSLTLTGQRGEFGQPEIVAPDEGTTSFTRMNWYAQEMTTDESVPAWGDAGITEYHGQIWSAQNNYIGLFYSRVFINIAYCNEFIREVSPKIGGLSSEMQADAKMYLAEARFLRAYFYFIALDAWGNVPFVTENDLPGAFQPKQIKRADLFNYIEGELTAALPELADAGQNEYARADKAAAWALLARLYLNAEVYAGNARYTDCITNCNSIINSNVFSLHDNYGELFLADNHLRRNEIILPIAEDGKFTKNYGGVTFIIHAQVGGATEDADNGFGIGGGGWAGTRPSRQFVDKFDDVTGATDKRAMFFTDGQSSLDITNMTSFDQGYLSTKWKNVTSTGAKGQDGMFVDTDFPIFRLADVYLMYAEAVLRGGTGGDKTTATSYVNKIRTRAYAGDNAGNIVEADLDLPFLLDERSRELFGECVRRTDLIRFGQFTGDTYLWDWKGNVKAGAGSDSHYNIFPIPVADMAINTNLIQNDGY